MIWTPFLRTLTALLLLTSFVTTGISQSLLDQPQEGVLLLKYGTTLRGHITPAGDRFIVLLGDSGEARVPAADVIAVVGSLQEAYQFKLARIEESLAARVELAQWCIQHDLHARAADQILAAEQRFGKQLQLDALHHRLIALATAKVPLAVDDDEPEIATISFEQHLDELSSDAIDSFTSTVQPLLLNRCATGGCHNHRGTSDFVLFRPFLGQAATQRMTERNFNATLVYVNRQKPLDSPLLVKAHMAHGGAELPAIQEREQKQLATLKAWLQSVSPNGRSTEPRSIAPGHDLLYQATGSSKSTATKTTKKSPVAAPVDSSPKAVGDPFDPARFNQRHHARGE